MLAQRYELKFPIQLDQKVRFLARARHALEEDPHGENATYRVSSVYFDTPDFTSYWEKLDGEAVRRKFRLRYYSIDHSNGQPHVKAAFMEIKHRINNTVFKERVRLSDEGAEAILSSGGEELVSLDAHVLPGEERKQATINAIERAASRPGFRSVHVITYLREAWMGTRDERLRLTFDSCCRVGRPTAYLDVGTGPSKPILPENMYIMELKFNHAVPRWIRDIAVHERIMLDRFSKYAAGVEAAGLCNVRRCSEALSMNI